jgi:MFS family permease
MPGFRLLTFGQFTSTIGDYCYAVALPWLVLSGGGSAASLGIVLVCYGIPRAVLTVPGGSLADRFSPRLVMLSSDFTRCALTVVFAVLAGRTCRRLKRWPRSRPCSGRFPRCSCPRR